MHESIQQDSKDSAIDFDRVVWPVARDLCGGGQTLSIEIAPSSDLHHTLDVIAGIDVFQLVTPKGGITAMRGIASRVQWGFPFNTFTIRKIRDSGADTEYAKRLLALTTQDGWIHPYLWCHAYVSERKIGDLLSVAVTRTDHLYEFLANHECETRRAGNEVFWVVPWEPMRRCGFDVRTWIAGQSPPTPAAPFGFGKLF